MGWVAPINLSRAKPSDSFHQVFRQMSNAVSTFTPEIFTFTAPAEFHTIGPNKVSNSEAPDSSIWYALQFLKTLRSSSPSMIPSKVELVTEELHLSMI
jgi:hypothetical protein